MDEDARKRAIMDETFSNEDALLELFNCKTRFEASPTLSSDLLAEVSRRFDAAVREAMRAMEAHESVAKVLKTALIDAGRLIYVDNEKKKHAVRADAAVVRDGQEKVHHMTSANDIAVDGNLAESGTPPPSRSISPSSPIRSMAAAMSKTKKAASAKASAKRAAPPAPVKEPAGKRRKSRKKPKSQALVGSSDESDIGGPVVVDPFDGLPGFENASGDAANGVTVGSRQVLVRGKSRDALIMKFKFPSVKLREALQPQKTKATESPLKLVLQTPRLNLRSPTKSEAQSSPATQAGPASPHSPLPDPQVILHSEPLFSPTAEPTAASDDEWESVTEASTAFPPFPPITAVNLPHFMKGITIAIENIIADHTANPKSSLLEIVEELENNIPTLPHQDDRPVVLEGGQYVYRAVYQTFEDSQLSVGVENASEDCDGHANQVEDGHANQVEDGHANEDGDANQVEDRHANEDDDVAWTPYAIAGYTASQTTGGTNPPSTHTTFRVPSWNPGPSAPVYQVPHTVADALGLPTPPKPHYKGPGRRWMKTREEADPDFAAPSLARAPLPPRKRHPRKAARTSAWDAGVKSMFDAFLAHIRREYQLTGEKLGVTFEEGAVPVWGVDGE